MLYAYLSHGFDLPSDADELQVCEAVPPIQGCAMYPLPSGVLQVSKKLRSADYGHGAAVLQVTLSGARPRIKVVVAYDLGMPYQTPLCRFLVAGAEGPDLGGDAAHGGGEAGVIAAREEGLRLRGRASVVSNDDFRKAV